ncbi:glycosyltransferase family 39 protein [Flavobacterium fluviatile]|uniref:glycosyltransferase family 39 protein n=1 Tax=Flavobacterium fluviatile TaxID=1862387 RepID=UPI0013D590B9|nr:glycosyltransferase family 39 protein [Flavobacterium fluviatile]
MKNIVSFKYNFVLIILIVTTLLYFNSLSNDFNIDDHLYYNEELANKDITEAVKIIFTEPSFTQVDGLKHEYRSVSKLLFYLEVKIFGMNPFVSHTISLLFFQSFLILLWYFIKKVIQFKDSFLAEASILLLAVHPLSTEIVCSSKAREELYVVLFGLVAVISLFKYLKTNKKTYLISLFVCYILAILSKKTGILLLVILPLLFYMWSEELKIKKSIIFSGLLFFVGYLTIYVHDQLESGDRVLLFIENPLVNQNVTILERIKTGFDVIGKYITTILYPKHLSSYYGYPLFDVIKDFSVHFFIGLLFFMFGIPLGIYLFLKRNYYGFFLLSTVVILFSFSNIPELLPGVFADRFGFIIMLFMVPLLVKLVTIIASAAKGSNQLKYYVLVLSILFLSMLSYKRSLQWKDLETLFTADVQSYPENHKLLLELGNFYFEKALAENDFSEKEKSLITGRKYYEKSIAVFPDNQMVKSNLEIISCKLGNEKKCNDFILKSNSTRDKEQYLMYLHDYFLNKKDTLKAIKYLEKILIINPDYQRGYETINRLYFKSGQEEKGIKILEKFIAKYPESPLGYAEMANYILTKKDTLEALPYIEKAAIRKPYNPGVLSFLINYFQKKNNYKKTSYYNSILSETE